MSRVSFVIFVILRGGFTGNTNDFMEILLQQHPLYTSEFLMKKLNTAHRPENTVHTLKHSGGGGGNIIPVSY